MAAWRSSMGPANAAEAQRFSAAASATKARSDFLIFPPEGNCKVERYHYDRISAIIPELRRSSFVEGEGRESAAIQVFLANRCEHRPDGGEQNGKSATVGGRRARDRHGCGAAAQASQPRSFGSAAHARCFRSAPGDENDSPLIFNACLVRSRSRACDRALRD